MTHAMPTARREERRWRGWRALGALAVAALVAAAAVPTPAQAALTDLQVRHTRMFLEEFRDEYRALRDLWRGTDFCQWPHVVCNADDTVELRLSGLDLEGEMPEVDSDINGEYVAVTSVDLSNNPRISDDFESDWKRLTKLRRLDLSGTSLEGELPRDWERMASLEYLNIARTSACKSLPQWRADRMQSLRVVDFSNCNFRGTLRSEWGSFALTEAHFDGNNFCGCLPSTYANNGVLRNALVAAQPALEGSDCSTVNRCGSDMNQCGRVMTEQENTLRFLREFADEFSALRREWTGTDYCSWSGVTCDADGRVSVNLSGRGLDGDMPELDDDIDGSKVLVTSIDLSNNPRLDDSFEEEWGRLKQLVSLNLSATGLSGQLPDQWNGMSALETLDVHGTAACRSLPRWVLPKLRYADLSGSSFYGSLRSEWAQMTTLQDVRLGGNNFCGCVPSQWSGVPALQAAVAAGSGINDALVAANCANANQCGRTMTTCRRGGGGGGNNNGGGGNGALDDTQRFLREFIDELPALRTLWSGDDHCAWPGITCHDNGTLSINLNGRGLVGDMPELDDDINGALVNVVSIDLGNNPGIRDGFESDWAGLSQLQYLDLSNTGLYGNIPDAWNGMSSLREVRIRNTAACRGLPNWSAARLRNLRVVDFSNNNMGGALASSWSTFTALESVNFAGNHFCGCAPGGWSAQLVQALGSGAPAAAATCGRMNWCTSQSFRCTTTPNTNTDGNNNNGGGGGGGTTTPVSSTLQFLRDLGSSLGLQWTGDDYCAFDGVTCTTVEGVQMANVSVANRGLSALLPEVGPSVNGALTFVSTIDLSQNAGVRGTFPNSWAALKQLAYLDLSGTGLHGNVPDAWNGMGSLQEVRISNTAACRSLPNWNSGSLPSLRVVDFSSNANMRGVLTNSFGTFRNLESLNLQGTAFCGCVPQTWAATVLLDAAAAAGVPTTGCAQNACTGASFMCPDTMGATPPSPAEDPTLQLLRRIAGALTAALGGGGGGRVSRALLTDGQTLEQNWTGDDYCNSWAGVECDEATGEVRLDLSSADLSGELPQLDALRGDGVSLTSIDFSDNPRIEGAFPASWGWLSGVRTVRLRNVGLASSLPVDWEGMHSLEELTVTGTSACGTVPAWDASKLANLRSIDLSNNKLSGELPAQLGGFGTSQLVNFTLAGNDGICGCAPASWDSAVLLNGASAANPTLTSATCSSSPVQCNRQPACLLSGRGNGGVATASAVLAWAVAAVLAVAVL